MGGRKPSPLHRPRVCVGVGGPSRGLLGDSRCSQWPLPRRLWSPCLSGTECRQAGIFLFQWMASWLTLHFTDEEPGRAARRRLSGQSGSRCSERAARAYPCLFLKKKVFVVLLCILLWIWVLCQIILKKSLRFISAFVEGAVIHIYLITVNCSSMKFPAVKRPGQWYYAHSQCRAAVPTLRLQHSSSGNTETVPMRHRLLVP